MGFLKKLFGIPEKFNASTCNRVDPVYLKSIDLTDRSRDLTRLSRPKEGITDISPLAGLTNLSTLRLNSNQITDISPLADLTNLTRLLLGGNKITDDQIHLLR